MSLTISLTDTISLFVIDNACSFVTLAHFVALVSLVAPLLTYDACNPCWLGKLVALET